MVAVLRRVCEHRHRTIELETGCSFNHAMVTTVEAKDVEGLKAKLRTLRDVERVL